VAALLHRLIPTCGELQHCHLPPVYLKLANLLPEL
jgi:hypothetical protein